MKGNRLRPASRSTTSLARIMKSSINRWVSIRWTRWMSVGSPAVFRTTGLGEVEVDAAPGHPLRPQLAAQLEEDAERVVRLLADGSLPVQGALGVLVRQSVRAPDHGARYLVTPDLGLVVHLHDEAHRQPVLVGDQGAHAVGQGFREHGDDAVHHVDARAAPERLLVHDAAFFDVMGHIGDVHPHLPEPLLRAPDRQGIIVVLGIGRVDGEDQLAPQVQAALQVRRPDPAGADPLRLLLDLRREIQRQLVPIRHGEHIHARIAQPAQDPFHLAGRTPVVVPQLTTRTWTTSPSAAPPSLPGGMNTSRVSFWSSGTTKPKLWAGW
jgi:hypothetical protein